MRSDRSSFIAPWWFGLVTLSACGSTGPSAAPASPFFLSNPVTGAAGQGLRAALGGNAVGETVVFVSLPSGTIPGGLLAAIGNRRSGQSVTASLVDGGMDPTPIAGQAGDTLDIVVSVSTGMQERFIAVVPLRARPIVVRTEPRPHKRDVPLNAYIVVVFSEPIDPNSLTGGSLQVRRGTEPVAGQIQFLDQSQVSLVFRPSQPLEAFSDYELVVTAGIHDVTGDPLEEGVVVPFTTGLPSVGELRVNVVTQGDAPDPDGYVVTVAHIGSRAIAINGTVSFAMAPGQYLVSLSGLASNCFRVGGSPANPSVVAGGVSTVDFSIECPLIPPNGLLVVVRTGFAGTGWPSTFPMHVDNGNNISIPANGYFMITGMAPGFHEVWIKTPSGGGSFCVWPPPSDGWTGKSVTMVDGGTARIDFAFTCIP